MTLYARGCLAGVSNTNERPARQGLARPWSIGQTMRSEGQREEGQLAEEKASPERHLSQADGQALCTWN